MKIFVSGSLRKIPVYSELCHQFVKRLGEQIVKDDHILLTGCRGSFDYAIAEAAHNWLTNNNLNVRKQIVSYRLKNDKPVHRYGSIHVSKRKDWELSNPSLSPPEQIAEADVTIFVAGRKGTFSAKNWARIAGKPILGVAQFGGAGAKISEMENDLFKEKYAHLVEKQDFDMLHQDTDDMEQLVKDLIYLGDRVVIPKTVSAIMSFKDEYLDVFNSYKEVCTEFGFFAKRTDETLSSERIIPRIFEGIKSSAFVIADVSEPSMNVFYEIGYAQGLGIKVIVTAKKGTIPPFDLADIPIEYWADHQELKSKLKSRVRQVTKVLRKRRH